MQSFFVFSVLCLCSLVLAQEVNVHSALMRGVDARGIREDPDKYKNVTELIATYGYPYEQHYVQTSDGFILSVQRITNGRKRTNGPKRVVFLQHGFLDTSATYVNNMPEQSLGFMLADQGFDVWLGNNRGNYYSRRNANLSPNDKEFWSWTWDEMGSKDIPAMVNYVLQKTGEKKIAYVGHSQGCTQALACFSSGCDAEFKSKISIFIALAPVATLAHVESTFIKVLANIQLDKFIQFLGLKEFLPSSNLVHFLVPGICDHSLLQKPVCENLYCLAAGCDTLMDNVNTTRIPVYLSHLPGGTSVLDASHWAQAVRSGVFQSYDWGSKSANINHYGQPTPPLYDLRKNSVPIMVYHGGKDTLATKGDVFEWLKIIGNLQGSKYFENYGHGDFTWGIKANRDIYDDAISRIRASFD